MTKQEEYMNTQHEMIEAQRCALKAANGLIDLKTLMNELLEKRIQIRDQEIKTLKTMLFIFLLATSAYVAFSLTIINK